MPNIDRINGVTISDITSVDNQNISSISNINGQSIVTTSFLLDEYGTDIVLAYSVRKLSSTYSGAAMRVRETGFNTEADIGFDSNGNLDESALLSHVGSNNGFIVTWYDQSGQGGNVQNVTMITYHQQVNISFSLFVILMFGQYYMLKINLTDGNLLLKMEAHQQQ